VGQHLQEPHSLSNPTTANIPIPTAFAAITTAAFAATVTLSGVRIDFAGLLVVV